MYVATDKVLPAAENCPQRLINQRDSVAILPSGNSVIEMTLEIGGLFIHG